VCGISTNILGCLKTKTAIISNNNVMYIEGHKFMREKMSHFELW